MQTAAGGTQSVIHIPFSWNRRSTVIALAILGAVALLTWGYLEEFDTPTKAATQWADAMRSGNKSAALLRTCTGMQNQVRMQQQLSAQLDSAMKVLVASSGPGKKIIPQEGYGILEWEKEGAFARVKFELIYRVEVPIGNNVIQSGLGGSVSEYWNMTREGWGPNRWKWCGYGGLAQ